MFRISCLLTLLLAPLCSAHAQNVARDPAITAPLRSDPSANVRRQSLASGEVTHQVQVRTTPDQAQVIVRSIQPDSVIGDYRIDFEALDTDGDGFISRAEAKAHATLDAEFNALDSSRSGRLDRAQLAGWLR
jgi:hypothetical protein